MRIAVDVNKKVVAFVLIIGAIAAIQAYGDFIPGPPPSTLGHTSDEIQISTGNGQTDLQTALGDMNSRITDLRGVSCGQDQYLQGFDASGVKICRDLPTPQQGGTGDIEGVIAGSGLTGGGTSGTVTLSSSLSTSFSCGQGSALRTINLQSGQSSCVDIESGSTTQPSSYNFQYSFSGPIGTSQTYSCNVGYTGSATVDFFADDCSFQPGQPNANSVRVTLVDIPGSRTTGQCFGKIVCTKI